MKTKLLGLFLLSCLLLTSCGGGSKNGNSEQPQGEKMDSVQNEQEVQSDKTIAEKLKTCYDLDGKEIELTGIFDLSMLSIIRNSKFTTSFKADTEKGQKTISGVKIGFGKKKNSLHFPEKYQMPDVEVYDYEANQLTYNTKVKIRGKVKYTSKGPKKRGSDNPNLPEALRESLRKMEDINWGDGNDYSYEINNVVITKAE